MENDENPDIVRLGPVDPSDESSASVYLIKEAGAVSRSLPGLGGDPFSDDYSKNGILTRPYSADVLLYLYEINNTLSQCVNAMATNIDGFGFDLMETVRDQGKRQSLSSEIDAERERLETFFEYVSSDMDFTMLRERLRIDLEVTGNAYIEVIRTETSGEVAGFEYIPSQTMRLTARGAEYVDAPMLVRAMHEDVYEFTERTFKRQFRRFVQFAEGKENRRVWFKEFGDPRRMNGTTGEYLKDGAEPGSGYVEATEVIHLRIEHPRYEYGVPRWASNMLAVLGGRDADEVNHNFFQNGAMFEFAVLISGGQIGDDTARRIKEFLRKNKGKDNAHKVLVIQSETPRTQNIMNAANVSSKIELKELNKHDDMLFKDYQEYTSNRIRSSFRIAPLYIGLIQDYTDANAHTSKEVTEEQVFQPERNKFDFWVNRWILPVLGAKYHVFKTRGPTISRAQEMAVVMTAFKDSITGREARKLLDQVTDIELDDVDSDADLEQIWLNYPAPVTALMLQAGQSLRQVPGSFPEDDVPTGDERLNPDQTQQFDEQLGKNGAAARVPPEYRRIAKAARILTELDTLQGRINGLLDEDKVIQ